MSEHDVRETAKRIAAETVADHLEISEKTRIKTSLRNACLIVGAIVTATVSVCCYLNKIGNSQERIEASLLYKVPEGELTAWANAQEKMNRDLLHKDGSFGLNQPDPVDYRPRLPGLSAPTRP